MFTQREDSQESFSCNRKPVNARMRTDRFCLYHLLRRVTLFRLLICFYVFGCVDPERIRDDLIADRTCSSQNDAVPDAFRDRVFSSA